jgi:hypothetical protein
MKTIGIIGGMSWKSTDHYDKRCPIKKWPDSSPNVQCTIELPAGPQAAAPPTS